MHSALAARCESRGASANRGDTWTADLVAISARTYVFRPLDQTLAARLTLGRSTSPPT
jgi:hypothetical protein